VTFLASIGGPTVSANYSEQTVEAAFLYRFAGYVEWPADALAAPKFTIAVLEDDAVAKELQHVLAGHTIKGKAARVRAIHRLEELDDAQILYVGHVLRQVVRAITQALDGSAVLVVSDEANGLDDGAMINFFVVDQHVRFEISLLDTGRSRLRLSSDLLSVAARVRGGRLHSLAACTRSPPPFAPRNTACPQPVAAR
jgi:hypothetical protein